MANLGLSNLSGIATGFKNKIINGDFDVWQRGTSFAAVANNSLQADRWNLQYAGDTLVGTVSKTASYPTVAQSGKYGTTCFGYQVTTAEAAVAATDLCGIGQNIEGHTYKLLKGKTCTFSFWVASAITGTYCVSFRFGDGSYSYIAEYTIDSASTWEKKTVTLTFDQDATVEETGNGVGLYIFFMLMCGSTYHSAGTDAWEAGNFLVTSNQVNFCANLNATFVLAQVQLEEGSVATPFDDRNYGEELILCQRFFEKSFGIDITPADSVIASHRTGTSYAATAIDLYCPFIVEKGTVPTLTFYPSADAGAGTQWCYYNLGWVAANVSNIHKFTNGMSIRLAVSALTVGNSYLVSGNFTAEAEL